MGTGCQMRVKNGSKNVIFHEVSKVEGGFTSNESAGAAHGRRLDKQIRQRQFFIPTSRRGAAHGRRLESLHKIMQQKKIFLPVHIPF